MFKLGYVHRWEEVMQEVVAKRCQLQWDAQSSPSLLSPVKVKSGVENMETPVSVCSLFISCMIKIRMVVSPCEVDGQHVTGDPVVEEPQQQGLTGFSGCQSDEDQLKWGKGVLQKQVLVALENMEHPTSKLQRKSKEGRQMCREVLPGFFQKSLWNREEVKPVRFKSRHLNVEVHICEDMVGESVGDPPIPARGERQVEVKPPKARSVVAQVEPVVRTDAGQAQEQPR